MHWNNVTEGMLRAGRLAKLMPSSEAGSATSLQVKAQPLTGCPVTAPAQCMQASAGSLEAAGARLLVNMPANKSLCALQAQEQAARPAAPPGRHPASLTACLRALARSRAHGQLLHPQEWARYEGALQAHR